MPHLSPMNWVMFAFTSYLTILFLLSYLVPKQTTVYIKPSQFLSGLTTKWAWTDK